MDAQPSVTFQAPQRQKQPAHPLHTEHSSWPKLPFLSLSDEIRNVEEEESEFEGLSSQQIFLWLQGLFLFSLVWTVAGTIDAESRKKFDVFFRNLIMGIDDHYPRPKSVKLTKNNIFPERGTYILLYELKHVTQTWLNVWAM